MKIIKWAILGLMIILPFIFINRIQAEQEKAQRMIELALLARTESAISDGTMAMKLYATTPMSGQYKKAIEISPEQVIDTFFQSLFFSYEAAGSLEQQRLRQQFPAIYLMGYDGYYEYVDEKIQTASGNWQWQKVLSVKKPYFVKLSASQTLYLTLEDEITYFNQEDMSLETETFMVWYNQHLYEDDLPETFVSEIEMPINGVVQVEKSFDLYRRQAITKQIEKAIGSVASVQFPVFDSNLFGNALDDLALVVWQELPGSSHLESASKLTITRAGVLERPLIYGFVDVTGERYYTKDGTTQQVKDGLETIFGSEEEAAKAGYWPIKPY